MEARRVTDRAGRGGAGAETGGGIHRRRAVLIALLWLALAPGWVAPAHARARGGIDAVLVLDSSGSMRHTDPLRLRVPAAKLFISLLGSGDRVGVISFSGRAWPVIGLTAVIGASDRRRLFQAVDKISSRGAFTNLYAALEAGRRMLAKQARPGARRYLILMSDGRMDVGDTRRDAELTHRLLGQELPELAHEHVQIFSIAFTRASDVGLLRRMARTTHGLFRLAAFDRDLNTTFTTLFERVKRPEMLPIQGGEFTADASIREVTVVATKQDRAVRIVLQAPDGGRWSAKHRGPGMRWFRSERFDMITIPHPKPGKWRILSSAGHNKAYIVTNLGLETNVGEQDVALHTEQTVRAWLSKDHAVVSQPDVLRDTRFVVEIQRPDGVSARYTMLDNGGSPDGKAGDGVFTTDVQYYKPGAYTLRIIVTAPTFERQITRYFHVNAPPAAPVEPAPKPASKAAPAKPKPEPAPKPASKAVPKGPVPAATVGLWRVAAVFLLVNGMLFGLGGGGFLLWRRLAKGKAARTDESDESAEESQ